ncbi:ABC transporter substrate-binding protein [Nakamurella flava]|uniref:ABC transporter substrate-binding protein n=1 Tax=Nakamurella flava TaxID=2576308 RepID=A0A4U6QMP9_9ACTN|nr:ABC transporter substrate-binding protein [Nakamurella flava]TKV61967.1 ABC transporter substrate-binding protein [Nakamurella flava]
MAVLIGALAAVMAGCGGSDSAAGSASGAGPADSATAAAPAGSATVVPAARDLVPQDIRDRGTLVVATGEGYPPFEFYDEAGTTLQGVDPEMVAAIAGTLGLRPELQVLKFDGIIPGLQGGRFDMAAAAMGVTAERNQVVDFVTYFEGGASLLTRGGNPEGLTLDNLCGRTIGAQKGTIYVDNVLPKLTAACEANGQPAITVDVYPDAAQTNLAVSSGRAVGVVSDYGPLAYVAQQSNGQFSVLDANYDPAPYGFAVPKGSELAPAIEAAVEALIADGTYQQVLQKWNVSTGAITDPTVARG